MMPRDQLLLSDMTSLAMLQLQRQPYIMIVQHLLPLHGLCFVLLDKQNGSYPCSCTPAGEDLGLFKL